MSVADVAALVLKDSVEDGAARARGFTMYMEDSPKLPMLPRSLSEGQASLLPGIRRPVVSLLLAFGPDFEPRGSIAVRAELVSSAKLSYTGFEQAIHDFADPYHALASAAHAAATALHARRLHTADRTTAALTDEDGRLIQADDGELGHAVVQEIMIATNAAATASLVAANRPMMFRNDADAGVGADYGHANLGHATLGLDAYGHFTSPIRRYPDLVNQRCLIALIEGTPSPYRVDEIAYLAASANATAKRIEIETGVPATSSLARTISRRAWRTATERLDTASFRRLVRNRLSEWSPQTAKEFLRRAAEGLVTCGDIAFALFGTGSGAPEGAKRTMLGLASAHPDQLRRIWTHATNEHGVHDYTSLCHPEGDGWVSLVKVGDEVREGRGRSPIEARGAALRSHIAECTGIADDGVVRPAKPLADGDAKAKLSDLCRLLQWDPPEFVVDSFGRDHAPAFVATVVVRTGEWRYTTPTAWGRTSTP